MDGSNVAEAYRRKFCPCAKAEIRGAKGCVPHAPHPVRQDPADSAAALHGALCGASVLELVLPSFYPRPDGGRRSLLRASARYGRAYCAEGATGAGTDPRVTWSPFFGRLCLFCSPQRKQLGREAFLAHGLPSRVFETIHFPFKCKGKIQPASKTQNDYYIGPQESSFSNQGFPMLF